METSLLSLADSVLSPVPFAFPDSLLAKAWAGKVKLREAMSEPVLVQLPLAGAAVSFQLERPSIPLSLLMSLFLTLLERRVDHGIGFHVRLHLKLRAGTANLREVTGKST